jgi:ribosome-binding factor A
MNELKREKIREIIQRQAAEFVRDISGKSSLITITRVDLSQTGKEAKILFTTIPESEEDTAEKFLSRKSGELKRLMISNSKIGNVPSISFKIDRGERNRQRLDELSGEI